MKLLNRLWNDPVWSKVISAIIIAIAGSIYSLTTGYLGNKNLSISFIDFWNYKIDLWKYLAFSFIIVIGYLLVIRRREKGRNSDQPKIIFDSSMAASYEIRGNGIQIWDGKQSVGEAGRGDLKFENGIITLKRHNNQGRYMITLEKYLTSKGKEDYVKNNIYSPATRIFLFSYDARVINGKHHLALAAIRNQTTKWLSNKGFDIVDSSWQNVKDYLRVSATEDFVLAFEDNWLINDNSTVQITNLIIEEISTT